MSKTNCTNIIFFLWNDQHLIKFSGQQLKILNIKNIDLKNIFDFFFENLFVIQTILKSFESYVDQSEE